VQAADVVSKAWEPLVTTPQEEAEARGLRTDECREPRRYLLRRSPTRRQCAGAREGCCPDRCTQFPKFGQ
jgi:hypothetical protein